MLKFLKEQESGLGREGWKKVVLPASPSLMALQVPPLSKARAQRTLGCSGHLANNQQGSGSNQSSKEHELRSLTGSVRLPTLQPASCVTLGESHLTTKSPLPSPFPQIFIKCHLWAQHGTRIQHPHPEACTPVGDKRHVAETAVPAPLPPRNTISQVSALQLEITGCTDRLVPSEGYAAEGSATGGCGHVVLVTVINCPLQQPAVLHTRLLSSGEG